MKDLVLSFPIGSNTGWGNCSSHIRRELWEEVYDFIDERSFETLLPVLHAVRGVDMLPTRLNCRSASRNVGYAFIEDSILVKNYADIGNALYDHVCAGSTWCAQILQEAGVHNVSTVIQGVDTELFSPSEDIRPHEDWFTVFSGGKWEYRKGQDVVIAAMKVLMERHRDVYLMTNWHNPWPQSADTMLSSTYTPYSNPEAACRANLDMSRVWTPREIHHFSLPDIYAACDVGLFPNRCEAGTNLVMMEFMAMGKPVIATTGHGHRDVTGQIMEPLRIKSTPFTHETQWGPLGMWEEPDLDDTISALELAYRGRQSYTLEVEGQSNRQAMLPLTWSSTASQLKEVCINGVVQPVSGELRV